jgi:hypothetical protein
LAECNLLFNGEFEWEVAVLEWIQGQAELAVAGDQIWGVVPGN